jgi:putative membrane protein
MNRSDVPANPKVVAALIGTSDRALTWIVYGLSTAVCLLVVSLIVSPHLLQIDGLDVSGLPRLHAVLNGSTALLLLTGYVLIRTGRIVWHRRAMVGAFSLSCLFLISYVIYHSQAATSTFGGEGWIRPTYFLILVSHIVLAPVVLPLALYSVIRALRGEFTRHRQVARWTFPVWLYVAVTGVTVYLMMAPYYGR